jgi:hypothetical protein
MAGAFCHPRLQSALEKQATQLQRSANNSKPISLSDFGFQIFSVSAFVLACEPLFNV